MKHLLEKPRTQKSFEEQSQFTSLTAEQTFDQKLILESCNYTE
jgi:hypothetical protein